MSIPDKPRMGELDAMRALAAIAVILFHFTIRFHQQYPSLPPALFHMRRGGFGVNFFFAISGFVILMTLYSCKRPSDFFVSRITRLMPTYWVSLIITFTVVALFSLPGREVTWLQALGNLTMFQEFYGVPHVDGVYWSLQVEVIFYVWMFLIFFLRKLDNIRGIVLMWLLLSVVVGVLDQAFKVHLSYTVTKMLMLEYVSMFAVGIVAYRATLKGGMDWFDYALWALALGSATAWDGVNAWWGCSVTIVMFWLFLHQRLRWLAWKPLVWLGGISYPLYLLHQNIGYVVMRETLSHGGGIGQALVLALVVSLVLATLVAYGVEQPAMRYLRDVRYRRKLRRQALQAP